MKEESNCFGLIIWIRAARGYTHLLRALSGWRDAVEEEMRKRVGSRSLVSRKDSLASFCFQATKRMSTRERQWPLQGLTRWPDQEITQGDSYHEFAISGFKLSVCCQLFQMSQCLVMMPLDEARFRWQHWKWLVCQILKRSQWNLTLSVLSRVYMSFMSIYSRFFPQSKNMYA